MTAHAPNIADLINMKRAAGYDGAFEALLRKPWYCPHCKASKTILQTKIPIGQLGLEPACIDCGKEGIVLIGSDYVKQFRKLLDLLSPYNRSGTA